MEEVDVSRVKSEEEFNGSLMQHADNYSSYLAPPGWDVRPRAQESNNNSSNPLSTHKDRTSILETMETPVIDMDFSASPICPAPICRQFWKAGNYEDILTSKSQVQIGNNYLHVHPKFLHSNATSHKWAFGAVAELLDNAIDEVQNGASFVILDKISNPRDGSPALLTQDDGGGMDAEAIRRCMSFGFSDKNSKSTIGRYGNGFKTSTMRLGADVIVFSRHLNNRTLTQSIGLLSYTYLSRTGLDRIVVPMVDYEYNVSTNTFQPLHRHNEEYIKSNLSVILQWSPYQTEVELMKQFEDIGSHGTKIIIFNLWFADDGTLEFDFDSDPEDIRLRKSDDSMKIRSNMLKSEEHIGNQYRYSLRAYLSILYLRIPQYFCIILRGKVVEHHIIAHDLKYQEFIMYRPQIGGYKEEIMTTIGFLKEAPNVYIHGFNVYHKNRLILCRFRLMILYAYIFMQPFWQVVSYLNSKGRGVVGVLEANFVEPTHNKQDFERTSLFQKLETRLKEMTLEYWDYHCGLIGYHVQKKVPSRVASLASFCDGSNIPRPISVDKSSKLSPSLVGRADPMFNLSARDLLAVQKSIQRESGAKTLQDVLLPALGRRRRTSRLEPKGPCGGFTMEIQPLAFSAMPSNQQEAMAVRQDHKKLRENFRCLDNEKSEEALKYKVSQLLKELQDARLHYKKMLVELEALEHVKAENTGPH
ncbi:protein MICRORCHIDIA 6-like isoform X2 [Amaranthus tricolor]|uniref:protein MICRORCHIDIA 6-like isoform X2 n=1 Tax=Amaranthus tricolor TaxID=29722 RepID=UPI0025893CA5|nr:protein MICRORCHIDIA 6-like isoform X2 [Amaranthus tricolor]